jgi:cytochrome b6-f complex iron-sulfur subunit
VIALVVSPGSVAVLIVAVMAVLFVFILALSFRETRRRAGASAAPSPAAGNGQAEAPRPARTRAPVSRRDFFRGGLLASLFVFGAEFGGASLAFLWPNLKGQFGSLITAGQLSDIKNFIDQNSQPFYYGAGRFYIVPYNGDGDKAGGPYEGLVQSNLMALYQKCVHLGCRVPFCQASQWFECPCHGSKYNLAGEYELGPAPTGLKRFPLSVSGTEVQVDTSKLIDGPPRGTDTIHEPPQGPFCVGGAAGG